VFVTTESDIEIALFADLFYKRKIYMGTTGSKSDIDDQLLTSGIQWEMSRKGNNKRMAKMK